MTLAIVLNAVSVTLLLTLLAATMRLPFRFRSGASVAARQAPQQTRRPRPVASQRRTAIRDTQGIFASE